MKKKNLVYYLWIFFQKRIYQPLNQSEQYICQWRVSNPHYNPSAKSHIVECRELDFDPVKGLVEQ